VRDDPNALREVFSLAAKRADAIISSGGVSVGEADFTKKIMQDLGDVAFWTLAIKPGRPMAFGKITANQSEAVLFGLPGNPVAVMVTFYQFVQDILLFMSGANHIPKVLQAKLDGSFAKKAGRTEFIRGILSQDDSGHVWVKPHGNQGSGVLRSMSEADCLITLSPSQSQINHGDFVDIFVIKGVI
jgi:molybdopterin molybdotransferase